MSRVNNCEYEDAGGRSGALKSVHAAMLLCVMEENVAAALSVQICKRKEKKSSLFCEMSTDAFGGKNCDCYVTKQCDFSSGIPSLGEAEVLLVFTSACFVFAAVTAALKHQVILPPADF